MLGYSCRQGLESSSCRKLSFNLERLSSVHEVRICSQGNHPECIMVSGIQNILLAFLTGIMGLILNCKRLDQLEEINFVNLSSY